jgi:hypothetical protein
VDAGSGGPHDVPDLAMGGNVTDAASPDDANLPDAPPDLAGGSGSGSGSGSGEGEDLGRHHRDGGHGHGGEY